MAQPSAVRRNEPDVPNSRIASETQMRRDSLLFVVGYAFAMITRLWRGWTTAEDADAYERFLLSELFPRMRGIAGFLGADVLRRDDAEGEVAFVTLTRFDTLESVRAFAGDNYEVPVLEPPALALLSRYDSQAQHFETSSFEL